MCNDYLLKIINFINNSKNRENPIESKESNILFLQKKRKPEQSFLDYQWNCMTPKKEVDFSVLKPTYAKSVANIFSSVPNGFSNSNNSTELSFDYNNKKQNSRDKLLNEIENLIKKIINSNNQNQITDLKENVLDFNEKFFKSEKNYNFKNTEISKFNSNINLSSLINVNSNGNDFLVNNCSQKNDKGYNKRSEEKVMLNNKLVYSNSNETDCINYSNNCQKSKKIYFMDVGRRKSKYRGVSKNGNQWQVLIMINKSKSYAGTYATEDLAARIYDILSIKNRGNKAKTNFIYTNSQIRKICNTDLDFKAKNIKEIISELLNEN